MHTSKASKYCTVKVACGYIFVFILLIYLVSGDSVDLNISDKKNEKKDSMSKSLCEEDNCEENITEDNKDPPTMALAQQKGNANASIQAADAAQGDQLNQPTEGDKNLNRDITGVVTSTAKSKSQVENSKLPPVPSKVVNTNQNGRR